MTSTFRKSIAHKVATAINLVKRELPPNANQLLASIPRDVRLKTKNKSPEFLLPNSLFLPLNDICKYELLHSLKQTGVTFDGITTIEEDPDQQGIIFNINEEKFINDCLKLLATSIGSLGKSSLLLQYIPRQNILVEFGSPNIAKMFHVGHLRSAIIGNYIANLHEFLGHHVTRINYLGDWGTQYGLLTQGYEEFGSEEELKADPIAYLQRVYASASSIANNDPGFFQKAKTRFSKMESGDPELLNQWKRLREFSIQEYSNIYKRLGVHFTEFHGESMYAHKVPEVLKELEDKGLITFSEEGAPLFKLPQKDIQVHLARADGSTVYLSRDIAAAIARKMSYGFDHMYYVVDHSQHHHFETLFSILEAMGFNWSKQLHHIKYGRVQGMSSRNAMLKQAQNMGLQGEEGTKQQDIVFLRDLLDRGQEEAFKIMMASPNVRIKGEDEMWAIADILAVSGLIVSDLKLRRTTDLHFTWKKALEFNGDGGMFLQYTHARLHSIERRFSDLIDLDYDTSSLMQPEAVELVLHLARFEEALYNSYLELEPCILVQYLFKLCRRIGKAHKSLKVADEKHFYAKPRMLLFHVSRLVLQKGMEILGLRPLEKV